MYDIGNGDKNRLEYDFSLIPNNNYEHFFNALPTLIAKKAKKINFCITKNTSAKSESSIARKSPNFIAHLVKILEKNLPKSSKFLSIKFDNISISSTTFKSLAETLASSSLQKISFVNISLKNSDFASFLKYFHGKSVNLKFDSCMLESPALKELKLFVTKLPKSSKVSTISLKNNRFTLEEISKCRKDLAKFPVDLRFSDEDAYKYGDLEFSFGSNSFKTKDAIQFKIDSNLPKDKLFKEEAKPSLASRNSFPKQSRKVNVEKKHKPAEGFQSDPENPYVSFGSGGFDNEKQLHVYIDHEPKEKAQKKKKHLIGFEESLDSFKHFRFMQSKDLTFSDENHHYSKHKRNMKSARKPKHARTSYHHYQRGRDAAIPKRKVVESAKFSSYSYYSSSSLNKK